MRLSPQVRNWFVVPLFAALLPVALKAAPLYDLSTIKLDGTAGENTFLVSNSGIGTLSSDTSTPALTWNLNKSSSGSYSYFVSYFNAQALAVGDSIRLSYAFTPLSTTTFQNADATFRVGLFNSNGSLMTADSTTTGSGTTLNAYRGYEALYRNAGTNATQNTFNYRGSNDSNLWASASRSAPVGAPMLNEIGTSDVTGSLTVTLLNASTIRLTSIINGTTAQTVDVTARIFTTFDTLSFAAFPGNATTQQSLTFSNLSVDYIAVPEPTTTALLLGAGLIIALRLRRRAR